MLWSRYSRGSPRSILTFEVSITPVVHECVGLQNSYEAEMKLPKVCEVHETHDDGGIMSLAWLVHDLLGSAHEGYSCHPLSMNVQELLTFVHKVFICN